MQWHWRFLDIRLGSVRGNVEHGVVVDRWRAVAARSAACRRRCLRFTAGHAAADAGDNSRLDHCLVGYSEWNSRQWSNLLISWPVYLDSDWPAQWLGRLKLRWQNLTQLPSCYRTEKLITSCFFKKNYSYKLKTSDREITCDVIGLSTYVVAIDNAELLASAAVLCLRHCEAR